MSSEEITESKEEVAEPAEQKADASESKSENSDLLGRKIFFLYPTPSVVNQVILELAQLEYEVYVARDQARLARVLKKYPDSIVYANLDDGMSEAEWERWISGILTLVPTLQIGCFTVNNDEEIKNKYIEKLKVTCGYMPLKVDMSNTAEKINVILDKLNSKGRRKYLRAALDGDKNATMNIPHNETFLNCVIKDISVVGLSCVFEVDPDFKKNTLIKAIQIKLQSVLINVDGMVFGSREEDGQRIYVILFLQKTSPETRAKIRKFIQQILQNKMDTEIN